MKREQIIEILNSYRIWFGDSMAIHEDAFCNLTDDILTLESEQIEKYKELIEVMEEIIQYYQGGKMFDGFDIAFHELSKLKMKIKQLKTELGI